MTDHHTATVNGVRLAYRAAGPEEGDPLVLLPALGESADDWALVRDALARERRVYALDLRGHGRSARTAEYSLELMRDDVLGFLDALGLDRADLVGHSAGAVVAHLVAQAAPHRVVRLALEDVPAPLPASRSRRYGPTATWTSTGTWSSRSGGSSTGPIRPGWRGSAGSPPRPWWWQAAPPATSRRTVSRSSSTGSPTPG
ncbi:alpha/beta fold hydrolase [Streptomyces sp. MS1.HAVA.3]|uniref:Alpha/beta fold hydrolase n=1 Tax=Streptomyces caledonius TaxID=3134107 RepID=A0ABU8U0F6_9ACTN